MELKELITKIEQWAIDRELDKKATVEAQSIKTAEEMAELIIGISKDNLEVIKDSIGDVFVTLVIGNMIDEKFDMEEVYKVAKKILGSRDIEEDKRAKIFCLLQSMMEVIRDDYYYDALFHTIVDLMEVAETYNLDFTECVQYPYDEIKDRKGVLKDGQFIKEADLRRK